tara:strand:- start:841 stop:1740 length:900 start_codon:yes stop_codon:yes gene_type:complete
MKELHTREFTGPEPGPHLLISGGVHGDEFEPIAAIRRLIDIFEDQPPQSGTLQFVPLVNEEAFWRGHRTAEEDNLDLARICPGNPEGSITEQNARAISDLIRKADYYIDLHTGGTELAVWPLAGYYLSDDPQLLETQRRMARAFNLPFIWGTSAKLDGRTVSVAHQTHIPAIYGEYKGSATMQPEGVEAYVDGCLNVMGELGLIERRQPEYKVEYVVEDDRPESGHMQICNLSPLSGFFEPAVQIGDIVKEGQPLGTVFELFSNTKKEILAEESGVVLVLRTFPRVREGETLGVVAPLS